MRNAPALEYARREFEVGQPRIRAAADEHDLDRLAGHYFAWLESHVLERLRVHLVARALRHASRNRDHHAGIRAIGDHRFERGRIDLDFTVERGPRIGSERSPALDRAIPVRLARRPRPALQVRERRLVGTDHARSRARLDRHVADRHAAFHRQRLDRVTAILDDVPGAACDTYLADDGEDQVLRGDARRQRTRHVDCERLRAPLQQALCSEYVADLGRADAERERAERAVGRGVAVPADDRHAGLREAELGPDDVDDAALRVGQSQQLHAEFPAVAFERVDLVRGRRVADRDAAEDLVGIGRRRMIHRR